MTISVFAETSADHIRNVEIYGIIKTIRKAVVRVDTRKKIDNMLDKINSENLLKRIYEFVKYIYIHVQQ